MTIFDLSEPISTCGAKLGLIGSSNFFLGGRGTPGAQLEVRGLQAPVGPPDPLKSVTSAEGCYLHWRALPPLEGVTSTGGCYLHWRALPPLEGITLAGGHYLG